MQRSPRAFTLIELLIVIGIILFLMTLMFGAGRYIMQQAATRHTQATIAKLHVVLDIYWKNHNDFPAGIPDSDTWPAPYDTNGVPLDKSLVFQDSTNIDFTQSEFDKTGTYFVDAWGTPIRYRKLASNRAFIWSCGLNAKDEIGPGKIWNASTQTYTPGPGGGNRETMGDDIPMTRVD